MNPIEQFQKEIVAICEKNHIEYLGVFGSLARGQATPESDIDLLVRFGEQKSLFDLIRVEREFSDTLRMPVDLVTEKSVSPYIKDSIQQQVQKIYERA